MSKELTTACPCSHLVQDPSMFRRIDFSSREPCGLRAASTNDDLLQPSFKMCRPFLANRVRKYFPDAPKKQIFPKFPALVRQVFQDLGGVIHPWIKPIQARHRVAEQTKTALDDPNHYAPLSEQGDKRLNLFPPEPRKNRKQVPTWIGLIPPHNFASVGGRP